MTEVGIEYQTVLGYPPVEFVHLAGDLGCHAISMKARTGSHSPYNPYGHGEFSFLDDPGLRRRMAAALRDRGVSISLAEGFVVVPGADLADDRASLVEAPMRSRAAQGTPVRECARLAVQGARAVLAEVRSKREKLG